MNIALYSFTKQGAMLARTITSSVSAEHRCSLYTKKRFAETAEYSFDKFSLCIAETFFRYDAHIVIGATGIVVRSIAPLLQHKTKDPAVVVCDQKGQFAISLLSGHIGGANALAKEVSKALNGTAIITTATDVENLPAIDILIQKEGLIVENPSAYTRIHASLLEGKTIALYNPHHVTLSTLSTVEQCYPVEHISEHIPTLSIDYILPKTLLPTVLYAYPQCLHVGIGCKKNTSLTMLQKALRETFAQHSISLHSIASFSSSHLKLHEPSLHALAEYYSVPLYFFTTEEMETCSVPNPSLKGMQIHNTQIPISICESATILASKNTSYIVEKVRYNSCITIAISSSL